MPKGQGNKGKKRANADPRNPLSVENGQLDLGIMTLESFKTWSIAALRAYLSVRSRNVSGGLEELSARAFIAWEDDIAVEPSADHAHRSNLLEYREKLKVGPVVLPDPFTLDEGWLNEEGRSNWPSLMASDISDLLQMTTPQELYRRLFNEYKQGKAYRNFTSGWVKEVFYHPVSKTSPYCILAAKVKPSMRTGMYEAWCAVEKDTSLVPGGKIVAAYCTCTAGLKGSCNHIVGLLFRVEYAVRSGMTKPSCTSKPCVWNVPAADTSVPVKLCEQSWKKEKYFKKGSLQYAKSVRDLATEFSPLSVKQESYSSKPQEVRNDLANHLRAVISDSCFMQTFDCKPFPKKELPKPCPPSLKDIVITQQPGNDRELLTALRLTAADIQLINESTLGQSSNSQWYEQRYGRFTASNFKRIFTRSKTLKTNADAKPEALLRSLLGNEKTVQTLSMKHGICMEPHAKKEYIKLMKSNHKKFVTFESGLVVDIDCPYLAASPDILVSCSCHGEGLCEIKCPESIKDQIPTHQNWVHLIVNHCGQTVLSTKSPYYFQIQGQLGITGRKFCDFYVYTEHGYFLQRIMFDELFWQDLKTTLCDFWVKYVCPALLSGEYEESMDHQWSIGVEHLYCKKMQISGATSSHIIESEPKSKGPLSKPKFPPVYLCGVCGGNIVSEVQFDHDESILCSNCNLWCHAICVHINDIERVSGDTIWLCPDCR